mgnify:CR=1 FL=1
MRSCYQPAKVVNSIYLCKTMRELDKKFYKIGDVSEILGIPESTLRYWETQFTIIRPKRNKKNIRYYTPNDIEIISKVYYLVKEKGLKLDAAQAQIRHNRDGVDKRFDAIEQLKGIRQQLKAFQESLDTVFPDIPAAK